MQLLENLQWRYATKKFDPSKKVKDADLAQIKEAVRLSAASYGLQTYKVLEVLNKTLRNELQPLSWNQSQVVDASHLLVFCNYTSIAESDVDELMQMKAEANKLSAADFEGYAHFIKGKLNEKSGKEIAQWSAKQTYLALANAMQACAELKIDCTPMEGFEQDAYNTKLGLTERGLNAAVLLAIGYRHAEDEAQHKPKVRKPLERIFEKI